MYTGFEPYHDATTGALAGITKATGSTRVSVPVNGGEWAAVLTWNAQQQTPLDLSNRPPAQKRRPRSVSAILTDFNAQNNATQNTILKILGARLLQTAPDALTSQGINVAGDEVDE